MNLFTPVQHDLFTAHVPEPANRELFPKTNNMQTLSKPIPTTYDPQNRALDIHNLPQPLWATALCTITRREVVNRGMIARKVKNARFGDEYELRFIATDEPVPEVAGMTERTPWGIHDTYRYVAHKNAVLAAIAEGKPVPAEVQRTYKKEAFDAGIWDQGIFCLRAPAFCDLKIGAEFVYDADRIGNQPVYKKLTKSTAKSIRHTKTPGSIRKFAPMSKVGLIHPGTEATLQRVPA